MQSFLRSTLAALAIPALLFATPAAGNEPTPATLPTDWAFHPIRNVRPPDVQDVKWPLDDIDRFILARLESESLVPVADAGRFTWLRRVSLDLNGLPPTPQQIADFTADASPDAYARVVDRLLASRAFGERWARHWLDLVGYADQIGLDNNVFAEHAWRYRDYVIDAFDADKPFDRFIREQIAGDLLPFHSNQERSANLIATGFLILGDIAIVDSDKARLRVDIIDQQVDKVGKAFLGLTLGCARCHDHKFDPIKQSDYYGMGGVFYSTDSFGKYGRGGWSTLTCAELPESPAEKAARAEQTRRHAEKVASLQVQRERLAAWKIPLVALETSPDEMDDDLRLAIQRDRRAINERMAALDHQIEHARFFPPKPPRAYAVHDIAQPLDMRITIRGNAHALGDVAPRGFLKGIAVSHAPKIPDDQSGRVQLAEWITDPSNPLTSRVAVNRIWQHLFGFGLVRSVDYFGRRGDTPSHPELLDFLATRFVKDGWSQKKLIRELVLSHTYRMSSAHDARAAAVDPDNRLYWRMNRCRLDAEALRDSLLVVSGKLIESTGGPAIPLEIPENVTNLNPKDVNPVGFRLNVYRPEQPFQRTVYLPIIRSAAQPGPAEIRNAFDFPLPAQCSGQRATTSVPTQAMFLMNSPMFNERASDLAAIVLKEPGAENHRLEQLWLRTLNRPIVDAERDDARRFLDQVRSDFPKSNRDDTEKLAWTELCHALLASNEFLMRL
jgi:hypothetical protein